MKGIPGLFWLVLVTIAILVTAGCVAPPNALPANVTTQSSGNPATVSPTMTPAPVYVTTVTPYINPEISVEETLPYHRFVQPTPFPDELSCRIYSVTRAYLYDGTAFTFNLQNPPMYISYSINPANISINKSITSRTLNKVEAMITYSQYDPQSFLEITVRNKTTGEIYLQDGFGTDYASYTNRTLKVMKPDDLLVEIKGNKINGTIEFWVKPAGNFNNPENMSFDKCTYWSVVPRDNTALALVTNTTPTPGFVSKPTVTYTYGGYGWTPTPTPTPVNWKTV